MTNLTGRWHAVSASDALAALRSGVQGLSEAEADRRRHESGPNRLAPSRPTSALAILAAQFQGVVTLLLVSAAALSLILGDPIDAGAITAVIGINAALGFTIELRARRAMEALMRLGATLAAVVRDGRLSIIDAEGLVPGDLLELTVGQTVPADARVVEETDLRASEAALTGESLPVSKQATTTLDEETPLADRTNMVYRGTTVLAGVARAVVTATGSSTEVGRIGTLTQSVAEGPTPLERRLDALGRRLVWVALGIAALVAVLGSLQGESWLVMLETGIALAVAAVPEGLPAVATIALAVGLRRMARRHALVRRLSAVEALGSATVICTDKTRTLTTGEMSVTRCWVGGHEQVLPIGVDGPQGGAALKALLRAAAGASRPVPASAAVGGSAASADPVDIAIRRAADALGLDPDDRSERAVVKVIPFSSDRKFAAAFHLGPGDPIATTFVKGAPATVLDMCGSVVERERAVPLTPPDRARLLAENERLAASGLRVLAVATGRCADLTASLQDLVFVGFVGLSDPPAPGVQAAIARLQSAGLRIIMLTGDQRRTAEAVGRQLGVLGAADEAVDSRDWRALLPRARDAMVAQAAAFSRISAEDKLRIVSALQAHGEVVAMLGDGVNDAPALRKADIGVAMGGRGTDVAREAAAIVLQDDRFETIAAAVEEGRTIGDNIRKFVFYLFSCNLAEVLVLLLAGVLALPVPFQPLQILWINLVTDTFPALALALEPGDADVMRRPPADPHHEILSRHFLGRVLRHAALIVVGTMTAFLCGLSHSHGRASTMAFMTLAFSQILHLGNARSDRAVLHPVAALANPYAVGAVLLSAALQLLPVWLSRLGELLSLSPLTTRNWVVVVICSSGAAIVGQAARVWRGSWRPDTLPAG